MNTSQKHALPGYDAIAMQLEEAAQMKLNFPLSHCWRLLELAESYAQEAQDAIQLRTLCMEMVAHLRGLPYSKKWAAERDARAALLERAERILNHDTNDTGTDGQHDTAQ